MNITNLTNRYFEKADDNNKSTGLLKDLFKIGAYAVLKEIDRLNFPAFTNVMTMTYLSKVLSICC